MSDPVVNVTNHSTRDLYIDRDPNWDDQILLLDGQRLKRTHRLKPEESAAVSVPMDEGDKFGEYMMGVIFADGRHYDYGPGGFYQMSIGQHAETGLLSVTDESSRKDPAIRYTALEQTPLSMTIEFVDANQADATAPKSFAY